MPCVLKLEPSPLRLPTLHSGSSPALPFTYLLSARGRSKFTVYGHKQACTLQTHLHNAVTLVWGSLRLPQSQALMYYWGLVMSLIPRNKVNLWGWKGRFSNTNLTSENFCQRWTECSSRHQSKHQQKFPILHVIWNQRTFLSSSPLRATESLTFDNVLSMEVSSR